MNVNAVARRLKGIDLSFVRGSCELAAGSTELLLDRLRFRVARDASGVRRKAADARVRVGAIPNSYWLERGRGRLERSACAPSSG